MVAIFTIASFDKEMKRLNKKYRGLANDFAELLAELMASPESGVLIPQGKGTRKLRMKISAKNKGKRDGARIITYYIKTNNEDCEVWLLSIYDKSEQSDINESEIDEKLAEQLESHKEEE